ncbi:uncharacterized protein TNCV_4657731 [Trichonephila clavipes]|nr:uncharacterized protein TNCV_4657731 [Trichonephila clavipes]
MPRPRPFVPASERRQVFNSLHGLSHPGSHATARLISTRFVWPRVQSDCRAWARACLHCQLSKITRHNSSPLQTFVATSLRFQYVHIYIIGPLPPAKSYRYCLTAINRFSRWVKHGLWNRSPQKTSRKPVLLAGSLDLAPQKNYD